MEIKRNAYLQQLTLRKDNGMIKVITGIRRCGKSFLLFTIFKRYLLENGVDVDHIIEIALDGIENEELRDPKVCFKYIKDVMKDDGKYYLLLDEVQFMSQFEEDVYKRQGDCTGKTELSDCKLESCAGTEPYDAADRTI